MIANGAYRASVALAVLVGLLTVASAQQSLRKQANPANAESKSAPAKKGNVPRPSPRRSRPRPAAGSRPCSGSSATGAPIRRTAGGKQVCYALAKPASQATQPPNRPRDPAYIFVSTRPSENVRNEISIVIGYPFKPGSDASVDIGSAKYAMYTQNDGAWIKNAAEEARMVDTMRRGSDLVVTGESGKRHQVDRPLYPARALAGARPRRAGVQMTRSVMPVPPSRGQ